MPLLDQPITGNRVLTDQTNIWYRVVHIKTNFLIRNLRLKLAKKLEQIRLKENEIVCNNLIYIFERVYTFWATSCPCTDV